VQHYTQLVSLFRDTDLWDLASHADSATGVLTHLRSLQLPAGQARWINLILLAVLQHMADQGRQLSADDLDLQGAIWTAVDELCEGQLSQVDEEAVKLWWEAAVLLAQDLILYRVGYEGQQVAPGMAGEPLQQQEEVMAGVRQLQDDPVWPNTVTGEALHKRVEQFRDELDAALQLHFDREAAAAAATQHQQEQQQQQQQAAVGEQAGGVAGTVPGSSTAAPSQPQEEGQEEQQQQQRQVKGKWYERLAATVVLKRNWLPNPERMSGLVSAYATFLRLFSTGPRDEAAVAASLEEGWPHTSRLFTPGMLARCTTVRPGMCCWQLEGMGADGVGRA
jgi:hypothetical protein